MNSFEYLAVFMHCFYYTYCFNMTGWVDRWSSNMGNDLLLSEMWGPQCCTTGGEKDWVRHLYSVQLYIIFIVFKTHGGEVESSFDYTCKANQVFLIVGGQVVYQTQ